MYANGGAVDREINCGLKVDGSNLALLVATLPFSLSFSYLCRSLSL